MVNLRVGQCVTVPDKNGIPLDIFWRRRLKDAAIDSCCHVLEEKTKVKKTTDKLKTKKGVE